MVLNIWTEDADKLFSSLSIDISNEIYDWINEFISHQIENILVLKRIVEFGVNLTWKWLTPSHF